MPAHTPRFANWHLYALAAVAAVVIALAITELGTPGSSARTSREVVTAQDGVVQTTVSGTGNVEPATDQTVNFATSGTLQSVDVSVGQHVKKGQLLATLDPTSADLALDQAKADLTAAKDNLRAARDGTSTSSGSTGSTVASVQQINPTSPTEFVSYTTAAKTTPTPTTTTGQTPTSPTGTPPTKKKKKKKTSTPTKTNSTGTTGTTTRTSPSGGTGTSSTGSTTSTKASKAQIAQDRASVDQAQATVDSDEQTLASTKLYAPVSGTIATLQDVSPGQSISAGGSGSASSNSSSTGSSGSTGSTGSTTAGSLGSSSSSSTSSSGFAEIINSGTLTMTVAFSESDISSIHVGQVATVSIDALSGVELGAHVTAISPVATTSSSVVSYDATLTLDQTNPKVRAGMSASADVITAQAQGVTVPNQAISGAGSTGTVQLQENGKSVDQQVVVGVRGASRSQIISGLRAGQQVVVTETLPALGTSSSASSSRTGTLGTGRSPFGGGGFAGGGGGFAGGGGGFFGRGGG